MGYIIPNWELNYLEIRLFLERHNALSIAQCWNISTLFSIVKEYVLFATIVYAFQSINMINETDCIQKHTLNLRIEET